MSRLPLAFFATAAVFGLGGMLWGIKMGIANDFTLAPAHAHLNLVGWASMGLMGAFYGYVGDRAPTRLGWANYAISTAAVVVMVPALAVLLANGGKLNLGVILGSLLAAVGMALFLASIVTVWLWPRAID
ncbi:MAG TPA: hypothetical protein VN805_16955 [Caulobacteraceae bacterium]|nr:hypothetical protein [Caulobacteraceae bacterium]